MEENPEEEEGGEEEEKGCLEGLKRKEERMG